jgi:hypothetical protein
MAAITVLCNEKPEFMDKDTSETCSSCSINLIYTIGINPSLKTKKPSVQGPKQSQNPGFFLGALLIIFFCSRAGWYSSYLLARKWFIARRSSRIYTRIPSKLTSPFKIWCQYSYELRQANLGSMAVEPRRVELIFRPEITPGQPVRLVRHFTFTRSLIFTLGFLINTARSESHFHQTKGFTPKASISRIRFISGPTGRSTGEL